LTHRLDSSTTSKIITHERPVEREIIKNKTKKEERIKGIFLRKIKIKVRNRIKDNLVDLVKKDFLS